MGENLQYTEVFEILRDALLFKKPLSLVRVGDGENIVLSQQDIIPMKKILTLRWAKSANKGKKGLHLPNYELKELLIDSIQKASIVGLLPHNDKRIKTSPRLKRKLTDKILKYHKIRIKSTCDACINRDFAKDVLFWKLIRNYKVLIIYKESSKLKHILMKAPYKQNITFDIPFYDFSQLDLVIEKAVTKKADFDIALISSGVNAVVLAQKISEKTGKICIDFGKGAHELLKIKKKK